MEKPEGQLRAMGSRVFFDKYVKWGLCLYYAVGGVLDVLERKNHCRSVGRNWQKQRDGGPELIQ